MKFLITAGPTREPLDPVRFLSNRSSGKMGYALADAALARGHEVIVVAGPVALPDPAGAKVFRVTTGDEMFEMVRREISDCEIFVMCAAVCDYKPVHRQLQKIQKKREPFALELEPTRDILASLTNAPHNYFVVGFAAETQNLEARAQRKFREKNCDLLVANNVSPNDRGMESDENELVVFSPNESPLRLPRAKKTALAQDLLKIILRAREICLTKKT